jgi:PAS domain S-box-containing protein
MLGFQSRADILQCHPSAISPPTQPDGRDSREKASEAIATAFDKGSLRFEWMHRRANGEDFPAEVTLTPVTYHGKSMLHCVWKDLTEERQLRAERVRARKTMESILRSLPVGVVVVDRNKVVRHVNAAALALMGYDSETEIVNRICHQTICPSDACRCPILDQGQPIDNAERVLIDRYGRRISILKTVVPIALDGEDVLLETFVDISQRKQMEEELRHAKEFAEQANHAKSEFLARMSHELRTPLTGILGFADLLLSSEFAEAIRREYLQTIQTSGRHLLTLINDVLDLSKIEAGHMEVQLAQCAPHEVLSEVVSVMRACAKSKNLDLCYTWTSRVPDRITSDAGKLRQILLNLAGNAIKFTHQGLVNIQAAIRQDHDRFQLIVEITDTGIGIPAEKWEAIFEPFSQADSGITREFGGTGLGLTISRQLARALGGDILVTSAVGEGSRFTMTVDAGDLKNVEMLDAPTADAASAGPSPLPRLGEVRFAQQHVLLVEDGHINSRFITSVLGKVGLRVSAVENGALGVAFALEHPCDLILMDMQMPVMDGYAAARKLREMGFTKPIIALTAHAMDGDDEKCRDAGCSGYVCKPIDIQKLLAAIIDALQSNVKSESVRHIRGVADTSPLVSSLPVDDDIFREIVNDFTEFVGDVISQMREAAARDDVDRLARLAHDLRGCAGTAGFPDFTDPARYLEGLAVSRSGEQVTVAIDVLDNLAHRIVLPDKSRAGSAQL